MCPIGTLAIVSMSRGQSEQLRRRAECNERAYAHWSGAPNRHESVAGVHCHVGAGAAHDQKGAWAGGTSHTQSVRGEDTAAWLPWRVATFGDDRLPATLSAPPMSRLGAK